MARVLPSGMVTFLLTDIEGSTKLFRRLGEGWPVVLERHHQMVRTACADHGGVEFKSEGDALLVAFESAADAFVAAVDAQGLLAAETWPVGAEVRVRMGLHAGIAFPRDGDYIALALHQAARVVRAANGGQVVASADAVGAAGSPDRITIERLGAYRLRDFDGPAELFQVSAAATRSGPFPILRAVPAEGHNIARPGDSFVGRARELEELADLVRPGRMVTVCGPGGMGKTRIVTELALRSAGHWNDGVWMVDLAAERRDEPIAAAVAAALGVDFGDEDPLEAVVDHLRSRRALIILDNCEHVLESARTVSRRMLAECPVTGLLATSRERLGVGGEYTYVLSSLPVSDDCVELFLDRARARSASVVVGEDDRTVVHEICLQLDGMPLAVELAAARANVLSVREILDGIRARPAALGRRDAALVDRQRTLRGLIDWSYALLDEAERSVFRCVSVFVGSFGLTTAAAAADEAAVATEDVADVVWSLVDKSLVHVERREGSTRYRLLETVRSVAAVHHEAAGEATETCVRLGEYYLASFPFEMRGNRAWRARLALERGTILALAERILTDGKLELGHALVRLWFEHAVGDPGRRDVVRRVTTLLEAHPGESRGLARLHGGVAKLLAEAGELDGARAHLAEGRRLLQRFGACDRLGRVQLVRAQVQLSLRRASAEELCAVRDEVRNELAQPSPLDVRADDLVDLAALLGILGESNGTAELREAAVIADELDDHVLRMTVLNNLAEQELRDGELGAAATHQWEAMRLSAELGVPVVTAFGLVLFARMAHQAGLHALAVRLHAAADVLLDACGFELIPDDRALSDAMLHTARQQLRETYDVEWNAGCALAVPDAIAAAEDVFAAVARGVVTTPL
jgi:predicted ATPase/class 3 adenylate cyclase